MNIIAMGDHISDAAAQPNENHTIFNIATALERKKTGKKWNAVDETEGIFDCVINFWISHIQRFDLEFFTDDRKDSVIMPVLYRMLYLATMLTTSIGDQWIGYAVRYVRSPLHSRSNFFVFFSIEFQSTVRNIVFGKRARLSEFGSGWARSTMSNRWASHRLMKNAPSSFLLTKIIPTFVLRFSQSFVYLGTFFAVRFSRKK